MKQRIHIAGYLWPVKPQWLINNKKAYTDNERVTIFGNWTHGLISTVFVGATNVGSILLDFDPTLKTNSKDVKQKIDTKKLDDIKIKIGDQMGMFKFGSTVVMIFEVPEDYKFVKFEDGAKIQFGQLIGTEATK